MFKIDKKTIKVVNFQISESPQGGVIGDIEITGLNADTNDKITITDISPENKVILGRRVLALIKRIVRYQKIGGQKK